MELMPGVARKLSLPLMVVSLLGWVLYVIGFVAVNNGSNYKREGFPQSPDCPNISELAIPFQRTSLYWFPHWVVVISGPFLYICTILDLIFAKWFTKLPTYFLTALYLVCGGAVIYTWAVELFDPSALIAVQRYCPPEGWLTDIEWGLWPLIEWVGALFTVVFLTVFMLMWSCFRDQKPLYYYDDEVGEYEQGDEEYEEEGEIDEAAEVEEPKEEGDEELLVEEKAEVEEPETTVE